MSGPEMSDCVFFRSIRELMDSISRQLNVGGHEGYRKPLTPSLCST